MLVHLLFIALIIVITIVGLRRLFALLRRCLKNKIIAVLVGVFSSICILLLTCTAMDLPFLVANFRTLKSSANFDELFVSKGLSGFLKQISFAGLRGTTILPLVFSVLISTIFCEKVLVANSEDKPEKATSKNYYHLKLINRKNTLRYIVNVTFLC